MLLKCVANAGAALGPPGPGAMMHRETTRYALEVGHLYRVFAMILLDGTVGVLIVNRENGPDWVPIGLFEVVDSKVPVGWEFAVFPTEIGRPGRVGRQALWGYHEIVASDRHYEGVFDGDPEQRRIFFEEVGRREAS